MGTHFAGSMLVSEAPVRSYDFANGQRVAFTGTSAASSAIQAGTVRLISTQDCFIRTGAPGTVATNGATSMRIVANQPEHINITPGHVIAVIQDVTAGSLDIMPCNEA